ncbi:diguanylate cyclase (GGDEF) domain-containing protein [Formivibrio citricus]|uniref:diguanylate cyclase n=1 Tax=Formivibrio citricus TaxID=83765 RepID=A0A1I4Y4Q4_9NEIS|nr:GGDEF domain-containing protein [Formivibrio citricus]SFN33062.1 diguanylate cyclase (GGDEF) domain-containing protein [Formivibrio citricus]
MSENGLPHARDELTQLEDQLRQYLACPSFWMRFPAEIEQRYEDLRSPYRLRRFQRVGWISLILFDFLALADCHFLPGSYPDAWTIRFLGVTPLLCLILLILPRHWMAAWRNFAVSAALVIVAVGLAGIGYLAPPEHPQHLYFQWLLLILATNLLIRPHFWVALPTTLVLFAIYAFSVIFSLERGIAPALNALLPSGIVLLICLTAMRRMEQDSRITYALKTQQKINHQRLASANRKLAKEASRDGLTGIYNRRMLDDNLNRFWRHAMRRHRPISVLFVDADYFKRYNDTYGHAAGDECLRWLAALLESFAHRPLDFVARFGGEEFVLVLPDTTPEDAGIIAEQIRARVLSANRPHSTSMEGCITVSIGVAGGTPREGQIASMLLEAADKALYMAKKQGRNRVRYAAELD